MPPNCRQLGQGKKCGVCAKICQAKAIDYEQKDQEVELDVGAIVLATGYDVFDPSVIPEYGYDRIANVVTALEFERLLSASGPTAGHLDRPSDMAMEKELEAIEKEHKKLGRQVKQFEEKQREDVAGKPRSCSRPAPPSRGSTSRPGWTLAGKAQAVESASKR